MYATLDAEAQTVAPPSSCKWDHDDIDDDDELLKRHHAVVLVAPNDRTLDVETLSASLKKPATRQSQLSKFGAPLGSSQSLASSLRRSAVSPRQRQATAPDVLLRSDAGERHWTYSMSSLALRSPQRSKRVPQVRLPSRSPRHSAAVTPRGGSGAHTPRRSGAITPRRSGAVTPRRSGAIMPRGTGAGAAGRFGASVSAGEAAGLGRFKRQRQFFRGLYAK